MKIIKQIINWFYRRQSASSSKKQMNKIMSEIDSDFMDYDGMGNYGRFPPEKSKFLTILVNQYKVSA